MYRYNASALRVIDGDTIDAMIDLGFSVWVKKRVRLYGIDAPETRTRNLEEKARGFQTKERLVELLEKSDNKFVLVSHGIGKYGRCLGTILINDTDINQLLIKEGLAEEYR